MDPKVFDDLPVLHNVWAVYPFGTDATAELARPQDWGNPVWMYRAYRLSVPSLKHTVVSHCWLLTDDSPVTDLEHLETFVPLIAQIMSPGIPVELCGRDFLDEEDFWDAAWGEMPPFYESEDADYGD